MVHNKRCNSLERLFSEAFLFCVKHHGRKLVVVEDEIIRQEFCKYIELRNAKVFETNGSEKAGFYILPELLDLEKLGKFACICAISINESVLELESMVNMPLLHAVLDLSTDDGCDYWKTDRVVDDLSWPSVNCFLMNEQLRPLFLNTFSIAEHEIDLICPWINRAVVNEEFILLLHHAVSRGVKVKITYGIGTDDDNERQRTSEATVQMLKQRFNWTDLLLFHRGNTHIKYLICDEKYMMCGSYNFLSFAADYEGDDQRDEGMEYIIDRNQIIQRRRQLFSW